MKEDEPVYDIEKVMQCDYDTKLAIVAWTMEKIVEHAENGGSFRHLIYTRLGFNPDAYGTLCLAGGLTISNEFDMSQMDNIRQIVKENKIECLKETLSLCDEPDCFNDVSCGWPDDNGRYRHTCHSHYRGEKE